MHHLDHQKERRPDVVQFDPSTVAKIPSLEPGCGSWVITRKSDGAAVAELYERENVDRVNQAKYRIETALAYLGRINREIAAGAKPFHVLTCAQAT